MTGASDIGEHPIVLIDEYEEGFVDAVGWVEVNPECDTPEKAIDRLESMFPLEDRAEEEAYYADGEQEILHPASYQDWVTGGETPWEVGKGEGALAFWVVKVVCKT